MERLFNLNSLTDIVSNAIGIAILLALVTFLTSISRTHEVTVPLAHDSSLAPRFYVAKDDALWEVDRAAILRALPARVRETDAVIDVPLARGRVSVELTEDAGFLLRSIDAGGWIERSAIARQDPFTAIDPSREIVFLFVYDSSGFEVLREVRRHLVARGVRVGWTIVDAEFPPHLCASPSSGACRYRPATP